MSTLITKEISVFSFRKLLFTFKIGKIYARFEGEASFSISPAQGQDEKKIELILNDSDKIEVELSDFIFNTGSFFKLSGDELSFNIGGDGFSLKFDIFSLNPLSIHLPLSGYKLNLQKDLPRLNLTGTAELDIEFSIDFIPDYLYLSKFVKPSTIKGVVLYSKARVQGLIKSSKSLAKLTLKIGRSALIAPLKFIGNSLGRRLATLSLKLGSQTAALSQIVKSGGRILGAAGIILETRLYVKNSIPGALSYHHKRIYQQIAQDYINNYTEFLAAMTEVKAPLNDVFFSRVVPKLKRPTSRSIPPDMYSVIEHLSATGKVKSPNINVRDWSNLQYVLGMKYTETTVYCYDINWQDLFKEAYNLYWAFWEDAYRSSYPHIQAKATQIISIAHQLIVIAGQVSAYQDILTFVLATNLNVDIKTGNIPSGIWDEWKKVSELHRNIFGHNVHDRITFYKEMIDPTSLQSTIIPFVD